jgi:hypothetical protein
VDGESLSGEAEEFIGEPKANPINSEAEPDNFSPSTAPTYYSIYPFSVF